MDAAVMRVPEFRTFYDGWAKTEMECLGDIREKLKSVADSGRRPSQRELKVSVDKIMSHISIYHDKKVQAATSEASVVAAGIWKTPLEAGFTWLGGWRPAAAIMLAYSLMGMQIENELEALLNGVDVPSMAALSHQQLSFLNDLQQTTKDSEQDLSDRLAHLQMMLAGEEMTKAASSDNLDAEGVDMEELDKAMDKKLECLRDLLVDADKLRLDTLYQMISILTPMQSSQFLVAAIELSMAIRELGMMKLEGSGEEGHDEKSSDSEELHRMAAKGQTAVLKKLVTGGADVSKPDFDGRTPLHLAASKGHTASISVLIKEGADVNAMDDRGTTPILYALKGGHDRAAKILIEAGAKVAESEIGVELCRAAASGNLEYLRTLVHIAKCDPNTTDYDHRTPLHLASAEGIYPAVDILLRAGADALAKDRHGFTPLEEARSSNNWLVVELLNKYVPPEKQVPVEGKLGKEENDDDMSDGEESKPIPADVS